MWQGLEPVTVYEGARYPMLAEQVSRSAASAANDR